MLISKFKRFSRSSAFLIDKLQHVIHTCWLMIYFFHCITICAMILIWVHERTHHVYDCKPEGEKKKNINIVYRLFVLWSKLETRNFLMPARIQLAHVRSPSRINFQHKSNKTKTRGWNKNKNAKQTKPKNRSNNNVAPINAALVSDYMFNNNTPHLFCNYFSRFRQKNAHVQKNRKLIALDTDMCNKCGSLHDN